jgi:hypothetical protein
MMTAELQRSRQLKQALTDFVLDAEEELAMALESFSAAQLSRSQQTDMHRRELVIDRFLLEGKVDNRTPIDLFIDAHPDLTEADRQMLKDWHRGFIGLLAITAVLDDGFEVNNWTTAKSYRIQLSQDELAAAARLKPGDIVLAQIAPISATDWMFFSKWISLGKLGKPKLAVAIGNFKQNYKDYLYSDAPELLAEAWKSVEKYHQRFIDFFGDAEVTMSGYQLSKKLTEFQEKLLETQLEQSGIDRSKSLQELAEAAGVSQSDLEEAASEIGVDAKLVSQALNAPEKTKMMTPRVELPPHLKKAEQVTVLTHPRWGQVFLTDYTRLKSILAGTESGDNSATLIRKYLEDPTIPAFVWHQLAQNYPDQLETVVRTTLERPEFNLAEDLDPLLAEFGKNLQTELPEIASVPLHLHNLFQEAVMEVSKDKPGKEKSKKKSKPTMGFQR